MAQQILNVSTPNSGLGDALRDASIKSNDNFTELYEGKVDKVTGKDLSDNNLTDELVTKINNLEANAQVNIQSDWNENNIEADAYIKNKPEQLFSSLGYFDYADLATQTTPITVASGVQTLLTNDTLGDSTNTSQPPYGVNAIWDADSDEFNFQQLSVGDTVDIRVHLKTTTTSANQNYHVDMKFAFDGPSEFDNRIFSQYVKTASEDEQTFITTLYIGSEDVKNYPARLYITSDDDATVKVVGWFCRVFRKSVNIVDIITDEAPNNANAYVRSALSWVAGYTKTAIDTLLGNKVDKNTPIVGATKTKLTYDSNGLVTSGEDALTSDIADSTNKRYVTDAQLVVIGNTSGTNTGDNATNSQYSGLAASKQDVLTDVNFGTFSNGLTAKTTPVDADTINLSDSADSNKSKKLSFTNLKAFLKSYFDTLYLIPCINITTSVSIDTNTTSGVFGQHGRNTKIINSTNAINIECLTSSNADFVASYTKIGTGTITFTAGAGATIVQLPTAGGVALTGIVGSNARLTRNGNTFYLELNNY